MEKNENSCEDCGVDCFTKHGDYYMVKDEIWDKHGVGEGMLCWDCLEKRMGREIKVEDLTLCPLNILLNPKTSKMLGEYYL